MEEVMKALTKIQNELDDQKKMIRQNGQEITDKVTQNVNSMLEEKFILWEENHNKLKKKVENQEQRFYFIDKQLRQRNIVFFGIDEKESSYGDMENNFIEWIRKYFSTDIDHRDIQEVKRIGRKGEKPRPLVVTFTTLGSKINILKQKMLLKDTQYYLQEDYPKYILEKRKELQQQLLIEKEKGNNVKIKYDKLIVTKPSNKRALPTSPETNFQEQMNKNTQTTKKNKKNQPYTSARRSNSVSEGVLKPSMLSFLVKNTDKTNNQGNNDRNT